MPRSQRPPAIPYAGKEIRVALACILASHLLAVVACADLVWLDFQGNSAPLAPLHQAIQASPDASVVSEGIRFTLASPGVGAGAGTHKDSLLSDFAMIDGEGATITLHISGLPAGSYTVESWHYDRGLPGALDIRFGRVGEAETVLLPGQVFSAGPATYGITSDGVSTYALSFRESGSGNRVRLNGLHLRAASDPRPGLPGIFVDIDYSNTNTLSGFPDPFFTEVVTDPGFQSGLLWRRRIGFGFNCTGNREVFEKDANGGVGNASPLVTIVRGLAPGKVYGVYVAFLSVPSEQWQVKAGLSPDRLELFSPGRPAGRVIDLGLSGENISSWQNRNQYLGFVGNVTVGPEETLWLYSDDGDGTDTRWTTRTWLEGFFLGAPVVAP